MSSELYTQYKTKIIPQLKKDLGRSNIMELPKLSKVVVSICLGELGRDSSMMQYVEKNLRSITGQKPVITKAKQSISNFKLRKGMNLGMKVTLRKDRMYDFIYKLVNHVLPRVRDFNGISIHLIDKQGNLNIGFKDQVPFLEIGVEGIDKLHGLEISIVPTASTKEEGLVLYKWLGFPFKELKNNS